MRLCGETVTVFNALADGDSGAPVYLPTVIRGVSWLRQCEESADPRGGMAERDRVCVRIPAEADAGGKAWLEPSAWRRSDRPQDHWTLAGGDVLVKGEVDGRDWTPGRLRAAFGECATVTAVADNRRAPRAPHWRVIGR